MFPNLYECPRCTKDRLKEEMEAYVAHRLAQNSSKVEVIRDPVEPYKWTAWADGGAPVTGSTAQEAVSKALARRFG